MKIVLLCYNQGNQVALANKVAENFDLAGIVIQEFKPKTVSRLPLGTLISKVTDRIIFLKIRDAWFGMLGYYDKKFPSWPAVPVLKTHAINSDAVKDFVEQVKPDLIMVSGTALLKKKILEIPLPVGIINLHTGLSPYVNGAPNCTNWCLSTGDFYLIGNTIMWIDAGIDSGDIIATDIVKFDGNESLAEIHIKSMDAGHALYLKVLRLLEAGQRMPGIKQKEIAEGKTYYNKDWNFRAKWNLLRNLKKFRKIVSKDYYEQYTPGIKLVEAGSIN